MTPRRRPISMQALGGVLLLALGAWTFLVENLSFDNLVPRAPSKPIHTNALINVLVIAGAVLLLQTWRRARARRKLDDDPS
ncbi:hypothetical protein K1W54_02380 [Micromonospora sp. CPCC 205371]|nr:hypothetical protein [Micromonospora sp. CPCC 205371]